MLQVGHVDCRAVSMFSNPLRALSIVSGIWKIFQVIGEMFIVQVGTTSVVVLC